MDTRLRIVFALALVLVATLVGAPTVLADSFTLSPPDPTLPLIPAGPADILWDVPGVPGPPPPPPSIGYPMAGPGGLGLVLGDVIDAISDGLDPVFAPHTDFWSVTPGSIGFVGTGVFIESSVMDTPPGATPGHAGDIFVSGGIMPAGANFLAPAPFGWANGSLTGDEFNAGLATPTPPGDNVNSYDLAFIGAGAPVLFSLAPLSPTLAALGAGPGDILGVGGLYGAAPVIVIPAGALGLPVGADIDALAIAGLPPPMAVIPAGSIEYSLTAATAGLVPASLGSGATILGLAYIPGPPPIGPTPITVHTPAALGLLPSDDLDALDVSNQLFIPEPSSMVLLGLGVLGLTGHGLRRRKKTR